MITAYVTNDIALVIIEMLSALILGVCASCIYMVRNQFSRGFVVTLAILPSVVALVVGVVNGSIGAGIATLGVFGLVRFRSVAGSAREIGQIFISMAIGVGIGMGYLGVTIVFFIIIEAAYLALTLVDFGRPRAAARDLRITIPENIDYESVFDDVFAKYCKRAELLQVSTSNLGSLYKLQYSIVLDNTEREKAFVDELRARNGNLDIVIGRPARIKDEL